MGPSGKLSAFMVVSLMQVGFMEWTAWTRSSVKLHEPHVTHPYSRGRCAAPAVDTVSRMARGRCAAPAQFRHWLTHAAWYGYGGTIAITVHVLSLQPHTWDGGDAPLIACAQGPEAPRRDRGLDRFKPPPHREGRALFRGTQGAQTLQHRTDLLPGVSKLSGVAVHPID